MSISQPVQKEEQLFRFFLEQIGTYRSAIDRLEKRLTNKTDEAPASIYDPVVTRLYIGWLDDYLKKHGNNPSEKEIEISRLDVRFHTIRDAGKKEYIRQMLELFRKNIGYYNPDNALSDPELFELNLRIRNHIEAMRLELEQLCNIENEIKEITEKDRFFIDLIPQTIYLKTYLPNDLPYSPPEIWWRHLEEKYGEPKGLKGVPPD